MGFNQYQSGYEDARKYRARIQPLFDPHDPRSRIRIFDYNQGYDDGVVANKFQKSKDLNQVRPLGRWPLVNNEVLKKYDLGKPLVNNDILKNFNPVNLSGIPRKKLF